MKIVSPSFSWLNDKTPDGLAILEKIARAGRTAYLSEPKGADADFVRRLLQRGHESVLEHAILSVTITCDRGVSHEEVRHRIASYTQESTRFCNYAGDRLGGEIVYIDLSGGVEHDSVVSKLSTKQIDAILIEWMRACEDAERHYMRMIELGATPQIARSVLNHSTKTAVTTTMNMREWRHFFKLRHAPDAHPQMRELTDIMLPAFKDVVPVIFDDIE